MKKTALAFLLAVAPACAVMAQTLQVSQGNVTYSFPSSQTGVMNFSDGKTLSVMGAEFNLADIAAFVSDDVVTDNVVTVSFSEGAAQVNVAGNSARYLTIATEGAHVTITQSNEVSDDVLGEITYILQGESSDGGFTLNAEYKASIELHGLVLTNPSGAPIDIQSGKRTALRVQEGTVNTLADGTSGSNKAAIYCKGHLEFKQKGTLNVTSNVGHAIAAKEYIEIKNTVINVLAAKKDGVNCAQYLLMESGTLNIYGSGDDGIQIAFKDDTNREAEDTGTMTVKGGKIYIETSAAGAKSIKTDGDFVMSKGEIKAINTGIGTWDSTAKKTKAAACIGVDGNLSISGGTFDLNATGGGGKGISVDGTVNISGGTFTITTEGGRLAYVNGTLNQNYTGNADNLNSDYKSSPKGIKADGAVVIDGGDISIWTKGAGGEGIESKTTLTFNGGTINIRAYEDGTNSSGNTYINGGDITVTTGTGDAIDANGHIYVAGGNITVVGAASPEQGFDAGDGCQIYFTGGTILAAGGGNSVPSSSTSTQAFVSLTQSVTAGSTVTVSSGETLLATFTIPAAYSSTVATRGPGGGGWGWGGSGGSSLIISTPEMVSGQSYTVKIGSTTTSATAKLTGTSSGPGH